MKKALLIGFAMVILLGAYPAFGLTIKIGTVAPDGSPWTDLLKHLTAQWAEISSGRVTLRVYSGGTAGDEPDIIRKIRLGQLQGAALTQLGLGQIAPDILALDVPFLITSNDEFFFVMKKMRPYLEAQFNTSGYRLLTWAGAGWVHFFAVKPIPTPGDLRKLRLGVPAGDDRLVTVWKSLGFNVVPLPIPDILAGLQSGLIDAFYSPPSAAAVFQWFLGTAHMSALKVVPVVVGLVIDNRTWRKIPEDLRAPLLNAVRTDEVGLTRIGIDTDEKAVAAMESAGLTVDAVTPSAERQWEALGREGARQIIGSVFSKHSYDLVVKYLDEYRTSKGGGAMK